MFSLGIFSTHIPYLAFAAFYVWFLLFGKGETDREAVCNANNHQIQIEHESDCLQISFTDFHFYNYTVGEITQQTNYICTESGEKRTTTFSNPLFIPQYLSGNLFCRPPPTIV